MGHSRRVLLPIYHILAELTAYPLVSLDALRSGPVALDPRMSRQSTTGKLWRDAETYLIRRFPGISVDELVTLRDQCWFGTRDGREAPSALRPVPLEDYVQQVAECRLQMRGTTAEPLLDRDAGQPRPHMYEPESRRAWRWLQFSLPAELCLAALANQHGGPTSVDMVAAPVDNLLREHGYCETHVHLGAAFDFGTAWAALVDQIGRIKQSSGSGLARDDFRSPAAELREGIELAPWLVRGAIVRFLLGAYLKWGSRHGDFEHFVGPSGKAMTAIPPDCCRRRPRPRLCATCTTIKDVPRRDSRAAWAARHGISRNPT